MLHVFVVLLTISFKSGLADACTVIKDCHESSNTKWQNGIFCYSSFSKTGALLKVNCSWLPYPLLPSGEYKQQLVWWNNIDYKCVELDAHENSKTISKYTFNKADEINKIWVSLQISIHECVKTNNFTIIPNVNCQAPLIQYAAQSDNLLKLRLDRIGQLRYKEMATDHWYIVNVTSLSTTISLPEKSSTKSFVVQQRCLSESCFHCRWTLEKSVPRELSGSPDVTVITEKSSPGKQRVSIDFKHAMHVYVDNYTVKIQRIPNSCESDITFINKNTKFKVNLSIAFFNVSVTACNKAGNSSIGSALVYPLTHSELPGKIFATYKYDMIFLTWSPLFINDFCVINWGTDYTQMKDVIVMDPIHNFSIPGPFESLKHYMISIYLHDSNMCMNSSHETTFGMTYIYMEEGEIAVNSSSKSGYRIEELASSGEYHVTVSGVTIKGTGPPSATLIFTTHQYAEGEFQINIISICVGLMIIVVVAVSACAYILNRTKNWYFPKIPNPRHSHLSKINEEPSTKIKLVQLLQTQEEVSCENMDVEVIEKVPVVSMSTDSCGQDIEFNMYSDYQNQWCPSAQAVLTQHDTTMSVPQTTQHISEEGLDATQLSPL